MVVRWLLLIGRLLSFSAIWEYVYRLGHYHTASVCPSASLPASHSSRCASVVWQTHHTLLVTLTSDTIQNDADAVDLAV